MVVVRCNSWWNWKKGETYNGYLANCDAWMNIHLRLGLILFCPNIFDLF